MDECCKLHKQAHEKMSTFIKARHALMGGNPRHWLIIYDKLRQQFSAQMLAVILNKDCPCQRNMSIVRIGNKELLLTEEVVSQLEGEVVQDAGT